MNEVEVPERILEQSSSSFGKAEKKVKKEVKKVEEVKEVDIKEEVKE